MPWCRISSAFTGSPRLSAPRTISRCVMFPPCRPRVRATGTKHSQVVGGNLAGGFVEPAVVVGNRLARLVHVLGSNSTASSKWSIVAHELHSTKVSVNSSTTSGMVLIPQLNHEMTVAAPVEDLGGVFRRNDLQG